MAARSLFNFLRQRLCELRQANAANVTITFALAIIPIVGLVGAAVDYSRATSVQTSMRAAADSTALMLSKLASTLNAADLQTKAQDYFKALFVSPDATNLVVKAVYTADGGSKIIVDAYADVSTDFMGIVGVRSINVGVESQVKWGNTRLRVALVLDNTGSMADDGKMAALKTATANMLDQLKTAANNDGDIYVSIVPFVKDVNVGAGNSNANWIYWDDSGKTDTKSWDANNGKCSSPTSAKIRSSCTGSCSISGKSQSTCTSSGTCSISGNSTKTSCEAAGVCSKSKYNTQSQCQSNGYKWTAGVWTPGVWTAGVWTPNDHSTWTGCVMDRGNSGSPSSNNYDTNVTAPSLGVDASLFPAEQYSSCPQAIMPLSYKWDDMKTMVGNMASNGNTNQAIGLSHGWMSLVGGGPYPAPPAMDPNFKYQQVIILMTDGLNTQNRWTSTTSSIDARQKITCDNVNAANITLYAIQVNTGGDPTSTLLQGCAGTAPLPDGTPRKYPDSSKFFLLTSADQLVTTFQKIGTQLSNLRIAQ